MSTVMEQTKRRPGCSPDGVESVVTHQLSNSLAQYEPALSTTEPSAQVGVLFAAQWEEFERVAFQLVAAHRATQMERQARIYGEWAQRAAELNRPDDAKRDHSISIACAQRAALIGAYPEDFTDTYAVLADIFHEKRVAS